MLDKIKRLFKAVIKAVLRLWPIIVAVVAIVYAAPLAAWAAQAYGANSAIATTLAAWSKAVTPIATVLTKSGMAIAATWGELSFWYKAAALGFSAFVLAPSETIEVVKEAVKMAADVIETAADAAGQVLGAGLGGLAKGATSSIWSFVAVVGGLWFFLLREDDDVNRRVTLK